MLTKAGFFGASLAAALPLAAGEAPPQPGTSKLKVIVTGGHPGDPEYGCGGTIARYSDLGHEVVLLYLNEGDPPDKTGPKRQRVGEAANACGVLKARPAFAGQIDGRAVVDFEHYQMFRRLLEAEKPNVVFTHWPIDNHADHRAISMLVYDAWVRLGRSFALYYYEVSNGEDTVHFAPTHYVDITATETRKRAACFAHASQAPEKFYALQEAVTRFRGIERGYAQAEAFIRHMQSPDFNLPLSS
ncbi:MAG TPA: PIG-L family deacetylase [Verrucomicrobiae bacterium]|nr:PIG-L family deacetylase [Verrucomicrobiae bacterium]